MFINFKLGGVTMWGKILAFVAKYGSKAIKWAWNNRWFLLSLGEAVFDYIRSIWG